MWLTRGCGSFSVVQVHGSSKNPVRIPSEGGQSPKRYTPLFGRRSRTFSWIVQSRKGLKAFHEEHPDCRLILVSLEPVTRNVEYIELIYVLDFLKMLWNGDIF